MTDHIRGIIAGFLSDLKKKKSDKDKIFEIIQGVIDSNTKEHIKDFKIEKDQMIFYVDSSVWGYQLNLLKPTILNKLKTESSGKIKSVLVRVRLR
jgi:hypothetical protein